MKLSSFFKYSIVLVAIWRCSQVWAWDLLEKAFDGAKDYEYVVNMGNTKEAVGMGILNKWYQLNVNTKKKCYQIIGNNNVLKPMYTNESTCIGAGYSRKLIVFDGESTQPLLVRIVKFLLRWTMILAIPMIMVAWILYMLAAGEEAKQKKAKTMIINVIAGILLALMSLSIVYLVLTVTKNSIAL